MYSLSIRISRDLESFFSSRYRECDTLTNGDFPININISYKSVTLTWFFAASPVSEVS